MNQHLHLVTLGVKDFKRSYEFYTKTLGWKPSTSQDDIAFFQMSGVVFAIYPREKLAEDALVAPEGSGFSGITLAYNARSESEVDEIISDLRSKEVKIMKLWQKRFWDHVIRDDRDFENHLHYIHYNPVKHGYVKDPRDWKDSSYIEWEKRGLYQPAFNWDEPKDMNWGE